MTDLKTLALSADHLPGEVVVALFFKDQKPLDGPAALLDWRLDGYLTRLLQDEALSGKAGEHILVENNGKLKADWALLVGGGKWQGLCAATYAALLQHIVRIASQVGFRDVAICLAPHEEADADFLMDQMTAALSAAGQDLQVCRLSCVPLLDD